jgi:hypothetical protein
MSFRSVIFAPVGGGNTSASDRQDLTAQLATVTSSAAIPINFPAFNFRANVEMNIRFGSTGIPAAAATDFQVPANTIVTFAMTKQCNVIRIFNPTGGNGNYWIQPLTIAG